MKQPPRRDKLQPSFLSLSHSTLETAGSFHPIQARLLILLTIRLGWRHSHSKKSDIS